MSRRPVTASCHDECEPPRACQRTNMHKPVICRATRVFFLQLKLPASPNMMHSFIGSQLVNFSSFRNAEWISVLNVALVMRYSSNAFSRQHSTAELAEHDSLWTILDPGFQEFVDETFGRLLRCVQLAGSYWLAQATNRTLHMSLESRHQTDSGRIVTIHKPFSVSYCVAWVVSTRTDYGCD